jgi:hypothetical protein
MNRFDVYLAHGFGGVSPNDDFYKRVDTRLRETDKSLFVQVDSREEVNILRNSGLILMDLDRISSYEIGYRVGSIREIPLVGFYYTKRCDSKIEITPEILKLISSTDPIVFESEDDGLNKIVSAVEKYHDETDFNDLRLTTGQVAKICRVSSRTVAKWFDGGLLKGYNVPSSLDRRIVGDELIRFLKTHGMYEDSRHLIKVISSQKH